MAVLIYLKFAWKILNEDTKWNKRDLIMFTPHIIYGGYLSGYILEVIK